MFSDAISLAVQTFCARPELTDEQVVRELVSSGIDPRFAARIVEFTPAAFTRVLLRRTGVRFSDSLVRQASGCSPKEQALTSEPFWLEINGFVEARGKALGNSEWLAIAGRSAEFDAVNQLLNRGASLDAVVLTPLVLHWPEHGPLADESGSENS